MYSFCPLFISTFFWEPILKNELRPKLTKIHSEMCYWCIISTEMKILHIVEIDTTHLQQTEIDFCRLRTLFS